MWGSSKLDFQLITDTKLPSKKVSVFWQTRGHGDRNYHLRVQLGMKSGICLRKSGNDRYFELWKRRHNGKASLEKLAPKGAAAPTLTPSQLGRKLDFR
jgi:hypothetical protein